MNRNRQTKFAYTISPFKQIECKTSEMACKDFKYLALQVTSKDGYTCIALSI
jgi:hypothetical protein